MKRFIPCPASWVEINLSHLRDNYRVIRERLNPASRVMAVVKADAYGHGLLPAARTLTDQGVPALAVASIEEGVRIREYIKTAIPIILLLGCFPEEAAECLRYDLTPVLYSLETAESLDRQARRRGRTVAVHLKIDTGMGRLGILWSELKAFLLKMERLTCLTVTGLTSHFGQADQHRTHNRSQWNRFQAALKTAEAAGLALKENHLANSAALLNFKFSHLHYVRPGLLLYGADPRERRGGPGRLPLKPVMTLKSRILQVKEVPAGMEISYGGTYVTHEPETIAVLPVGYANGYPRILSNRSAVLIRGRRFPVIGRVCMNLIIVRVDRSLGLQAGEETVLLGSQDREIITGDELADLAETIPYELFCTLGGLNSRKYLDN
jgi:alanine racemase